MSTHVQILVCIFVVRCTEERFYVSEQGTQETNITKVGCTARSCLFYLLVLSPLSVINGLRDLFKV